MVSLLDCLMVYLLHALPYVLMHACITSPMQEFPMPLARMKATSPTLNKLSYSVMAHVRSQSAFFVFQIFGWLCPGDSRQLVSGGGKL